MKLPVLMFLDSFENKCILKLSLNHWNIWQTTKLEGALNDSISIQILMGFY